MGVLTPCLPPYPRCYASRSHRLRVKKSRTMYLIAFPLLLIPFALYNMVIFLLNLPLTDTVLTIPLPDGRSMPVTTGDAIIAIALLMLYVEVVKRARAGKGAMDHVLDIRAARGQAGRARAGAEGNDTDSCSMLIAVELHRRDLRAFDVYPGRVEGAG